VVLVAGCEWTNGQEADQGIRGQVLWLEGNFMPGPDREARRGEPAERTLYIFPALKHAELEQTGTFYKKPKVEPVKVVKSDEEGKFSVTLPPGLYSLLSREEDGLYANLFDGEGRVFPIVVKSGEFTEVIFRIDYKAVF